jgi:hypothetical protein
MQTSPCPAARSKSTRVRAARIIRRVAHICRIDGERSANQCLPSFPPKIRGTAGWPSQEGLLHSVVAKSMPHDTQSYKGPGLA